MKKTFPLQAPGLADARVRDRIRQEINRYVRRERRKPLPDGSDTWDFACRVGPDEATAAALDLKGIGAAVDATAAAGAPAVFVEILKRPGLRPASRRSPMSDS